LRHVPAGIESARGSAAWRHSFAHVLRLCRIRHERGTGAKLCHDRGDELEQIQFLLGHASVQTTERYLGCEQNLGRPVNDLFDLRMTRSSISASR